MGQTGWKAEPMRPETSRAGAEAGYTFPSILVVLVVVGLSLQAASIPPSSARRADAEAELIFRGLAIRDAIESYWKAGGPNPRLPGELADLLNDPRDEEVRHLRRLYRDPMGGSWTLIRGADGGISGVASLSQDRPRRNAFFPDGLEHFKGAGSYADWTFTFEP